MNSKRHSGLGLIFLCLGIFLLTGMGSRPPLVGGPAPPFTLNDVEGRPVSLADYRGKVVLLTFWATWCEPCKKEMPEMHAAYKKLKGSGLIVLAINFGEDASRVADFAHHGRLDFPILSDPSVKVASLYGVVSLPASFFIDPDGIIREQVFGGTLTEKGIGETARRIQAQWTTAR
jgi:peroxiredoxin